ncbi:anillin-like isoform X3 [Palaemon carinicauda]|uniref:anillin-like isoform X3 n=1 Tax=Palaemon carinicauda TaxID=392227 RepID=UPI0035B6973E
MTDPFVQRMMARSQARRQNKENAIVTDTTRSRLKQINSLYSEENQPTLGPLRSSNSDLKPQQELSPKKVAISPVKEPVCSPSKSEVNTSPSRLRLNALARRTQELNNWEDDYSYHSTSQRPQVEVDGSKSLSSPSQKRHVATHTLHASNTVVNGSKYPASEKSSLNPTVLNVPSLESAIESTKPSYYFGDGPSVAGTGLGGRSLGTTNNTDISPDPHFPTAISTSASISSSLCHSVKPPSKQESPRTKLPESRARCPVSPTKRLDWDQSMIRSLEAVNDGIQEELEAQGFTPTESRSRLYFDFKKEQGVSTNEGPTPPVSPSKVKGMSLAEFMRGNGSPTKVTSPAKEKNKIASKPSCKQLNSVHDNNSISSTAPPPPPVILSCLPKSPASSPVRTLSRVPSPEPKPKSDRRDVSPSKVGEMRSRWEQHIRDASPERVDRSRSPVKSYSRSSSPTKFYQSQSGSHIQAGSSVKLSSPSKTGSVSRLGSQGSKVTGDQFVQEQTNHSDRSPKKDQGHFSRCGPARRSHRDLSPHKPPPVGDVVKGDAPMPEAVPLVDQPFMSSVRARAAAFDSAGGNRSPEKDPAERSVQERRALFNKKQGGVLVPKAPFGQSVPLKSLHTDNSCNVDMPSKTSVAHSHPVTKPTKKIAVEPSPAISQKLQQFQRGQTTYPAESETEYVESDESYADSTASDDTLVRDNAAGPPKPPRLYLEGGSSGSSGVSSPTRQQQSFSDCSPVLKVRSPAARLNSTEIDELHTSPKSKKEFIPKIKPGCIFPSLSDIESHSEAPDSQDEDDIQDSSFAESVLTCTSIESFGQKIQQMAQTNQTKILSSIAEQTETSSGIGVSMSESTMEAIDAIDNAIDEALDEEPTPPKRQRTQEHSSSSVYKTPKINPGSPGNNLEDENNLAHSISMYRKQKPDVAYTPVRQITRHPDLRSPSPEPPVSPSVTVSARIRELQEEVAEQQRVISQASNAVTVVLQHVEHQGTPQHVEAEKLLLLATQKRQTALDEIQRLKTEGALSQHSWAVSEDSCRGSISISNISVPLKKDFIESGMKGHEVYHLIVLVKHREQVISSQLLATPACVVDGSVTFPNLMSLHNLTSDFVISLEVYALRTSQARYSTIKKEQSRMKLTPLKRLQKSESRMASPSIQSPGGPYAVRSSSFQLVGFTHLNIATLTRNAWTLERVPFSSPLDGHLLMRVSCSFEGGITERGFLTMFEDIGGFGAWNRRWCVLNGMFLRYWRYPDDESKKEANGQIDLRSCTTRRVELVSRDVCARQHTFQLTCLRPAYGGDVSNLVQEVQGSSVVTRHLLSADSKEERIGWCNKLNKSLANIRAWDPDALRPEDYQV